MSKRYFCCTERRRAEIEREKLNDKPITRKLNGIDFLEVLDDETMPDDKRQRMLIVHFVKDPVGLMLNRENVQIQGGIREGYCNPTVKSVNIVKDPINEGENVLLVEVDHPGDFSIYTLRLLKKNDNGDAVLDGFDPLLSSVDFSFKVNCKGDFDCMEERLCPAEVRTEPAIDYLARDYQSFRRLMLDRMSVLMPGWKERSPADMHVALVELLAFVGDHLSYRQDAVATEAYFETARRRVSVRRHARLVDYFMHDGCNARVWVHLAVTQQVTLEKGTQLVTAVPPLATRIVPGSEAYQKALGAGAEIFESMEESVELFPSLNRLEFYTWGGQQCCLPKGATQATLRGRIPDLKREMVLIFKEIRNPLNGVPEDADPHHRHAVRLISVDHQATDPIGHRYDPNPSDDPLEVTEIRWSEKDALPFPLCISSKTDKGAFVDTVSVALGNIVLADHGRWITDFKEWEKAPLDEKGEELGKVPDSVLERISSTEAIRRDPGDDGGRCHGRTTFESVPGRFRPVLSKGPLTQAPRLMENPESAREVMHWEMRDVRPEIEVKSTKDGNEQGHTWSPEWDLLGIDKKDAFVVEMESDGKARLRFGDGRHGSRPSPQDSFRANYRVGNGVKGNIGAETLHHIVHNDDVFEQIINPLPASGGKDMESVDEVRQNAPYAFQDFNNQTRAVTPHDYALKAAGHSEVQKAGAHLRWTGSWHTVFVSVDPVGGAAVTEELEAKLRSHLEQYRLAGHDLEIEPPCMVPLELEMDVCVHPQYERSHVRRELLRVLSNRYLSDGTRGIFHPDNFSFGQTVFLSPVYAAAMSVEGVAAINVTVFRRQGEPGTDGLDDWKLTMGRFEIPCLDNDPNFPGRGVIRLNMNGGL